MEIFFKSIFSINLLDFFKSCCVLPDIAPKCSDGKPCGFSYAKGAQFFYFV